ncbi:MAG: isochorismatase family protein [Cyanobacteria bacterium]|nr:isochorismatase family protein [Cyanobacteriota bacterium]
MFKSAMLQMTQAFLLVVDVQERFIPIMWQGERMHKNVQILVNAFKELHLPIVVTEQYPEGLGHTSPELLEILPPTTPIYSKRSFGALAEAKIKVALQQEIQRKQILVCGLEAHVCVNQTVHQLLEAGYQVHLVEDAIASRKETNIQIGIAKMLRAGALPTSTEMALFELLSSSAHPRFKQVQALIK